MRSDVAECMINVYFRKRILHCCLHCVLYCMLHAANGDGDTTMIDR